MDYNNIDDDDVESLRLAALMTCKGKSKNQLNPNSISSTNSSAYSNLSNKNNGGRFPLSKRPYKHSYTNVDFRGTAHSNNNLIVITPTDSEGGSLPENYYCKTEEDYKRCTIVLDGKEKIDANNFENTEGKVSTKFSRLKNELGSDKTSDGSAEKEDIVDSDDADVLLLGQQDEDLDDLDKLMDIMEAEIADEVVKPFKKENEKKKQCTKSKKEKSSEAKSFKYISKDENQKTVHSKVSEDYKMSLKTHIPLKSPTSLIKKSISPYNKLNKRSLTPRSLRKKSSTPDKYKYSSLQSKNYLGSLTPKISPERLSTLSEKNLSPKKYLPAKSHYTHCSQSSKRRLRSLSKDTDPPSRLISPLRRKRSRSPIRSKSRSPKSRKPFRKQSSSSLKRSRPVSPVFRSKGTKLLDNELLKTKDKIKLVDKDADIKLLNPVLEAKKRKFESNIPIKPTTKKINSVQVSTQTEKVVPEITNKVLQVAKKSTSSQMHNALKNISIKIKNDSKSDVTCRIVKLNSAFEKTVKQPRPRIAFGKEKSHKKIGQQIKEDIIELSSASEEDISKGNEYVEEIEKVEETSDSCDEITEEEEEEEIANKVQKSVEKKKELVKENKQFSSTVDLRTELKRRRALRMNTVQFEVKKKPTTFYPARLLQSAIRSVVSSSGYLERKHKKNTELPQNVNTEVDHKLKNCPIQLQTTGVTKNEELRKKKKHTVKVTDFTQM